MSTRRGRKDNPSQDFDPTPSLGKTIQRLRKAYNMSLGDLSEQSGVAKSIISQIERNETNPTLSTVYRLSRALDTTIDEVLRTEGQPVFIEHQMKSGVPMLESQDGLCRLAIAGPLNLVEQVQWYDFRAKPSGILESDPHPQGTVEHLYMLAGEIEVTSGDQTQRAKTGETLRFRGDLPHRIVNVGEGDAHATMMLVLRQLGGGDGQLS
ncbi:helix-turn-helix domain-containing protein [Aestuariivirga sp.]|jgi:transcriptional regulator with XRE-family HTH domain|uniref:helix-turn-helix domain-containing protein n=1 Tax=Aestuariivirga sp. TaxID=2650926 RepID=UPI003784E1F5